MIKSRARRTSWFIFVKYRQSRMEKRGEASETRHGQYADVIWSQLHRMPLTTIRLKATTWPRKTFGATFGSERLHNESAKPRNSPFQLKMHRRFTENNDLVKLELWDVGRLSIDMLGKVVGHKLLLHEVLDWAEVRPHKRLSMAIWRWQIYNVRRHILRILFHLFTIQMVLERYDIWENVNFMHSVRWQNVILWNIPYILFDLWPPFSSGL